MASHCPLCGMDEETLDHLCLLCSRINGLWQDLFSFWTRPAFNPALVQVLFKDRVPLPLGKMEIWIGRATPF